MHPERLDSLGVEFVRESKRGRWEIVVIEAGTSKNGNHYSDETLKAAVDLFDGRPLQVYELTESYRGHLPAKVQAALNGGIVQNMIGVIQSPRWDETRRAIVAEAVITAEWFRDQLAAVAEAIGGPVKTFGLSITAAVEAVAETARRRVVNAIRWVDSVDVVTSPAAGGAFLRALESTLPDEEKGMNEEQIRQMIAEAIQNAPGITAEQVTEIVTEAVKAATAASAAELAKLRAQIATEAKAQRVSGIVQPMAESYDDAVAGMIISTVTEAVADDATDADIRGKARALVDALPAPVSNRPAGTVSVVTESADKIDSAIAKLWGVAEGAQLTDGVPAFSGIREMYVQLTGDTELSQTVSEAVQLPTSFPAGCGTAMHKRARKAYNQMDFGADRLISTHQPVNDFKAHEIVGVGGLTDLPVVPVNNAYTEFTVPAEEKATITAAKRGKLLPVAWETIINDDIGTVTRNVDRMSKSAKRTLAKAVFALLSANPTLTLDSKALFHADHGNIGSTAFGYASLIAARLKMLDQTEPTSLEPMGIDPKQGGLLVLPGELEAGAAEILKAKGKPGGSNNEGNAVAGWFGSDLERVIVNPFATDPTDWFLLGNPEVFETIVVSYLFGRREPEIVLADAATAYSMFTKDVIEYKIRHCWGVALADYRAAFGAIVSDG
jgi:hypothetical protein